MFEFYERVSGARMHAAYVRPGGVHQVSKFPTLCEHLVHACVHCGYWRAVVVEMQSPAVPVALGEEVQLVLLSGPSAIILHLASRTYPLGLWMTSITFLRTSLFELMS